MYDLFGTPHTCRALLDSGSQSNLITKELCDNLRLNCEDFHIPIAGINERLTNITQRTSAVIASRFTAFRSELTFLVLSTITQKIPTVSFNSDMLQYPRDINLADPEFNLSRKIDVLLGADIFYELMCARQLRLGKNMPILQETTLGWIFTGSINLGQFTNYNSLCNFSHEVTNEMLDESLTKFWKIEEIPQIRKISKSEQYCEDYFTRTTTRDTDGKFIVRLPFSTNFPDLGDSLLTAKRRFNSLEYRFKRNKDLKGDYVNFMKEYELLNHMTPVKLSDAVIEQPSYVLPHHAVIKTSSTTTRCRVVFDGSAKTSNGTSLNDHLLVGPVVQDDLFAIVMRLRLHRYVLSADVKMMFRQILVHPDDRSYQQILWRYDEAEQLKRYNLNTVTYGTACAPYLATKCLQELSFAYDKVYPRTSNIIRNSFYMDDLLTSLDTKEEVLMEYKRITEVLNSAGFHLRKWCSNETSILEEILGNNTNADNLIQFHDNKNLKTLGIAWNPNSDTLNYSIVFNVNNLIQTKRTVLAAIAGIFDPLGLIGPATIKAKLFMQQLWQRGISWDEPLPTDICDQWKIFSNQCHSLNNISINRHVVCEDPITIEMHGFSDASEKAYGACIYLVSKNSANMLHSRLLCAKSRVAPQKKCTLPRLELLAALLLANLSHSVSQILDVQISKVNYYCDSTIVLGWLNREPNDLKTFVANRVTKIIEITNVQDWKHVSSQNNAADIISRGINPNELEDSSLWWIGPQFLCDTNVTFDNHDNYCIEDLPEVKVPTTITLANTIVYNLDIFGRISSLRKLNRVIAYCIRFKTITLQKKPMPVHITVEELEYSLKAIIRLAQHAEFQSEIRELNSSQSVSPRSKLASLNPFIDEFGIIRVGGRLHHSNLDYGQKHPIILPKKHRITRLVVEQEHLKHLHAGVQNLLSIIRLKYWPIDGKNIVKNVIRSCIVCFRINPKPAKFLMGELPPARVIPSRPFTRTGVDYAGPIFIKDGKLRRSKLVKTYICIFVCFSTRAVHIELVSDLTTDSFLNALKRFISRRGKPLELFSDNGSNFIGARNHFIELRNLLSDKMHCSRIKDFLADDQIRWSFIPAKSPHVGGIWEAAVKSTKFHLKRILGTASITFEEMCTILTQIEACLNSRPLSPLSDDPNDFIPLTPAHFLIGDSLMATPHGDVQDINFNRLSRYQRMQQLVQQFWTRWSKDYLTRLQQRNKWKTNDPLNVKVGTLVILVEDNLPPLRWPLGRIIQLHPGADKVIRVVTVKVSNGGLFKRSLGKICILPIDD